MTQHTDILIVGGGLAGTTLALTLGKSGHAVTLIDAHARRSLETPGFDGRSYALAQASQRMLHALNIWDALAPNAQPMRHIKVSDGRAGEGPAPFFLHFQEAELENGPMGYMVEDRHLRPALLTALDALPNVTHIPETTVKTQTIGAQAAHIETNTGSFTARLLIGADGRASGTAKRAGIKRTEWGYDQTALVCAIAHERPHDGTAHQLFMPPGPLAILPLTGNRSSIVWSETTTEAARINALPDADYLNHLRPRFGSFLGEIDLAGARFTYPLSLSLAQSFIAARVALIADAAHGVHPLAGQGLNAGFRDIAALAETLTNAQRRGEDIASAQVLARYEQWRRFDTATLAMATDGFNRLFSNNNPILKGARHLGMGLVQSLPPLRRSFIREAAGLTGDLPRLMQGAPL